MSIFFTYYYKYIRSMDCNNTETEKSYVDIDLLFK